MTIKLFYFLFLTAFLDCLNPTTIVTQLILLVKTRSSKFSISFIVSTYITYLLAGTLLFVGIAIPLKKFFSSVYIISNIWMIEIEIALIILGIIYLTFSFFKRNTKNNSFLKHLTPGAVFLLGFGSTLSDIPTAIPYFAFIAKMEQSGITMLSAIFLFCLYAFIYITPLLVIHLLFTKNQSFVILNSVSIERWVDLIGKWVIRLMIILVIIFLSIDFVRYFLGLSRFW